MNKENNRYFRSLGFNPSLEREHSSPKDYIRGITSILCITDIPEEERATYLPQGENQNFGSEKSDCITRAFLNVLETKFSWLLTNKKITQDNESWLNDSGYIDNGKVTFSDRYIAIKSGTTADGNSMKKVVDTIRTTGLIPKKLFPQVDSFKEYYDTTKITPEMETLAQGFKDRFTLNYEKVYLMHFRDTLKEDFIAVATFAWPPPVNGEYPAEPNYPFNHCVMIFKEPKWNIFDNYIAADSYIKKLAEDYVFYTYGYRIAITAQNDVKKNSETTQETWWQWIINLFFRNPLVV